MKDPQPEVWECEHEIVVAAAPEVVWALFEDVAGWPRWNAGVEQIELRGPFATGSSFLMKPVGMDEVISQLVEVLPHVSFLDETRLGDLRIFVEHRLQPLGAGECRVRYSLQAFGPGCEETGAAVSADFPEVLRALKALAETCEQCPESESTRCA